MPTRMDITGQRFGRLVVVSRTSNRRRWICRCDCGAEAEKDMREVRRAKDARCSRRCPLTVLVSVGDRFGRLVMVERHPHARVVWRCSCGSDVVRNPREVMAAGEDASCGCLARERRDAAMAAKADRIAARNVARVAGVRVGRGFDRSWWFVAAVDAARPWAQVQLECAMCGAEVWARATTLSGGTVAPCPCMSPRHGLNRSPTHTSWRKMRERTEPGPHQKPCYVGVKVYPAWRGPGGVLGLVEHIGERPPGTTLDRINPFGDYEPGNVRWATPAQQAANTRKAWMKRRSAVA